MLDFGIAKLLTPEEEALTQTIPSQRILTPDYASPEQIKGGKVTTSSDVYSLGVLLYELLSGQKPYRLTSRSAEEISKAITNQAPDLPSTARQDHSPITSHDSHSLRGDLDNIVLMALRKEPERRYASVERFSEDIRRHLEGLPVQAHKDTFSYRASKFVRRNKTGVLAALLLALALIGGVLATLWQARVAQAERSKAERRFNDVRQLANSFLFKLAPKIENLPGATLAREELIKLALEYLDSLSKEADDDAELQRELAAAYERVGDVQGNQLTSNLGDTQSAARSYEKALSIRQKLYEQNPQDLTATSDLASSYGKFSEIQRQVGTTGQVNEYFQKSLNLREEILKRNPNDFVARKNLADALRGKGVLLYTDYKLESSIEYYRRANEMYETLLQEQPDNIEIAEKISFMHVDIGEAQGWNGNLEGAETSLKQSLDLLLPLAEKHPNNQNLQRSLMMAYSKKASSTLETENYEKAVSEYGKAVEIADTILRADPQNFRAKWDVVIMKKNMADAIAYEGKTQESIDILNSVLERAEEISIGDRNNPKNLYEIAIIRFKIGEGYLERKDFQSALKFIKQSNEEFRTVVDLDPNYKFGVRLIHLTARYIADAYVGLAEERNDKDLYRKALQNYQSALKGFTEMKSKGAIGEYDDKLFIQIEDGIRNVEGKSFNSEK